MKILVDENIPNITVEELRSLGHDVLDVRGTPQQGMEDAELWRLAQFQERLLITDKGFAEHREEAHHGIIVVRLRQPNEQRIHARTMAGFRQFVCGQGSVLTFCTFPAVVPTHGFAGRGQCKKGGLTPQALLNGQGGRFGDNVIRYKQVRDERLGLTDHEMLQRLCDHADIER
jgi:predicted nuclease of predicted toxin-antitoxin system